jgi:hypothetical protein
VVDERREAAASVIVLSSSDEEGAAGGAARSRRPRDVEAYVLADFEEGGPGGGRVGGGSRARNTAVELPRSGLRIGGALEPAPAPLQQVIVDFVRTVKPERGVAGAGAAGAARCAVAVKEERG